MKDILKVFKYTFKKQIKTKAYIISTILLCCATLGILIGLKMTNTDLEKSKINIIDRTNSYNQELLNCNQILETIELEIMSNKDNEEIKQFVLNSEEPVLVLEYNDTNVPKLLVFDNDYVNSSDLNIIAMYIEGILKNSLASKYNLDLEIVSELSASINYELIQVKDVNEDNYLITYILYMLLGMMIMIYSASVAGEITYVKTNRVMELLITSVKPKAIFLGITMGIGISSLAQFLLIIIVSIMGYNTLGLGDIVSEHMGLIINNISIQSIIIYLSFFILGFTLYSLLNAGLGSLVSKVEDVGMAVLPLQFVGLIQFFLGIAALTWDDSPIIKFFQYFPFTSQTTMFVRYMMGYESVSSVLISLAILVITILLVAKFSIRLFKYGVIYYGNLDLKKFLNKQSH